MNKDFNIEAVLEQLDYLCGGVEDMDTYKQGYHDYEQAHNRAKLAMKKLTDLLGQPVPSWRED